MVTRALLLNRLAVSTEHDAKWKYRAARVQHAQTRSVDAPANSDLEKGARGYESSLRRIYKYFSEWKMQPSPPSPSSSSSSSHPTQSRSTSFFPHPLKIEATTTMIKNDTGEETASPDNEKRIVDIDMEGEQTEQPSPSNNPSLPLELHIQVLQSLPWNEQVRLAAVCQTWRSIVTDWVVPQSFRSPIGDTILGPQVINPLFAQLHVELGSAVLQAETLFTPFGEAVLDQPMCYPPVTYLVIRVSDLRTDGLDAAVDDTITVFPSRCCDRNVRIRDVLAAMDKFYRAVNEDRVLGDYKSWRSWKFLLETNRWWRRGYVGLSGKWEWRDGGKWLCLYAEKVDGAWEKDFNN